MNVQAGKVCSFTNATESLETMQKTGCWSVPAKVLTCEQHHSSA